MFFVEQWNIMMRADCCAAFSAGTAAITCETNKDNSKTPETV
jgi:hypothetical protein